MAPTLTGLCAPAGGGQHPMQDREPANNCSMLRLRTLPQASYMDMQPKNLSATILMWCDENNDLMWPGDGDFSAWTGDDDEGTWVSAANTIETIDRDALSSPCASSFYGHDIQLGIEGSLVHVGNTSFRGVFNLYQADDDSSGGLVARVISTGVYVDRLSLRPMPLPKREELLQYCASHPESSAPRSQHSQRPDDAYVWATAVRQTDCDGLGHLNNTRYAMYAEEALGAAVHHGAFDDDSIIHALAQQPPCSVHISYINEVKPYEPLFCAVWYIPGDHAFAVEMRAGKDGADGDGGTLAAVVVLGLAKTDTEPTSVERATPRL